MLLKYTRKMIFISQKLLYSRYKVVITRIYYTFIIYNLHILNCTIVITKKHLFNVNIL